MMPGLFTFIAPPLLTLLDVVPKLMPGIEKAVALYYNPQTQMAECKSIQRPFEEDALTDYHIQDAGLIKRLRQQKPSMNWVNSQNLEFETVKHQIQQLNIFDEQQVMVLVCGFENETDHNTDLIYIYLSAQNGNFGISQQTFIPTAEKHTIGVLVYNSLKTILEQNRSNLRVLQQVNHQFVQVMAENATLKNQNENLQHSAAKSNLEVVHETLTHFNKKYLCRVALTDRAIEKIRTFNGRHDNLIQAVQKAAALAVNLNFGLHTQNALIHEYMIEFEQAKADAMSHSNADAGAQRDKKTIQLLDRLEMAANLVASRKQKLTGENVGLAFEQPISAPAITDALKNHQKKVMKLMAENPDKWHTIRNEFRPIINILTEQRTG